MKVRLLRTIEVHVEGADFRISRGQLGRADSASDSDDLTPRRWRWCSFDAFNKAMENGQPFFVNVCLSPDDIEEVA